MPIYIYSARGALVLRASNLAEAIRLDTSRLHYPTRKTSGIMSPRNVLEEKDAEAIQDPSVSQELEDGAITDEVPRESHEYKTLTRRLIWKLDTRCIVA